MSKLVMLSMLVTLMGASACAPKAQRLSYQEARLVYADLYADLYTGKYEQAPFNRSVK